MVAGVSGAFGLCGRLRTGTRCRREVVTKGEVKHAPLGQVDGEDAGGWVKA